jgi:hypothetical protein
MEAFIGPRPPGEDCRHLDGKRGDARLRGDNGEIRLAYGTKAKNHEDSKCHGTDYYKPGEEHPLAKLTEVQVQEILCSPLSSGFVSKTYNISARNIRRIRQGKRWTHASQQNSRSDKFYSKGSNHHRAKLTECAVIDILTSPLSASLLVEKYGVTGKSIRNIRRRKTWKHMPKPNPQQAIALVVARIED